MWAVLRPLISYLASLVFRYMPFARGDRGKRKESGGGGGTGAWHILTAGAKCVRPGFLAGGFSSAKKLRATGASVSHHKANTTERRGTPSPAQQLCLPVSFSRFLVLNGFVSRSLTWSPLRGEEEVAGFPSVSHSTGSRLGMPRCGPSVGGGNPPPNHV